MPTMVVESIVENGDYHCERSEVASDEEMGYQTILNEVRERLAEERVSWWQIRIFYDGQEDPAIVVDMDDSDDTFFYLLTQEGYAWNSQIRDNMDVIVHRLYKGVGS